MFLEETILIIHRKEVKSMVVKNLNHTTDRNPPNGCSSWKDFYIKRGRVWPNSCGCLSCNNQAAVGAHVKKVDSYDNRWHIIPLCYFHNNQFGETLDVVGNWLEPINK